MKQVYFIINPKARNGYCLKVRILNNMGGGFDAILSYEVNQSRIKALFNKLSLGRLIYVFFLLKNVFTYKTATFDLSIDGKTHIFEQTWFVTVSKQPNSMFMLTGSISDLPHFRFTFKRNP